MAGVPVWLQQHPNAHVRIVEGVVCYYLDCCRTCKNSLRVCCCAEPMTIEMFIYQQDVGLNQTLTDTLEKNAAAANPCAPTPVSAPSAPIITPFKQRAMIMVNLGIPVIPLRPGEKSAFLTGWEELATTSLDQIDKWASEHPNANCGAVAHAKPDGVLYFEVDSPAVLERLVKETGKSIPDTFTVRSSPGKGHIYFRQTAASIAAGNISQACVKGGDWSLRVDRQYVVSPESFKSKTNSVYEILGRGQIADAPDWLVAWCLSQKTSSDSKPKAEPERNAAGLIPKGCVHGWMLTQAGRLRDMGLGQDAIEVALLELVHENCQPPIDDSLVKKMAQSICKYPKGERKDLLLTQASANGKTALEASVEKLSSDTAGEEASIPPFDSSVIDGIYKKFVELTTRGTTLVPQFVYAIVKAIVGLKMAGKVKFEDLDVEPLTYLAMCGVTGSGKGEAWRRVFKILNAKEVLGGSGIKIINSVDSGAGLKDAFFEHPEEQPILCFIDEVTSLGHKAGEKKNPEILDTMIELADSASISRVKAKKNKQPSTRTKNDAHLGVVMCGQDREVYVSSFTGRTSLGWWDRLVPEFGVPQETGDLPPINEKEAIQLLIELNSLRYSGTMVMSPEAKDVLREFWLAQTPEIRTKARWKKHLQLDAYLMAFGRAAKTVEKVDMEGAIRTFNRQVVIRRVMFHGEAKDRIGFYLGLIKELTEWMRRRLQEGLPEGQVARSWTDYESKTNARRNNEEHVFKKAMDTHTPFHLYKVDVKAKNGHTYRKYLPVPLED
jgi:hypothetical protein